jgi:hypothetical protein
MTQGLCAPCGAQRPLYLCLRGTSAQGRKVMSTTAEWLTSLGMSEYAERFKESDHGSGNDGTSARRPNSRR